MKRRIVVTLLFSIIVIAVSLKAQSVVRIDSTLSLKDRWQKSLQQAGRDKNTSGYWIGYSIKKMMGEHSFTGSFSHDDRDRPTLEEIIYNRVPVGKEESDAEIIRKAAQQAIDEMNRENTEPVPEKQVLKEIAFLVHFTPKGAMDQIKMSNLCLHVDLEDQPLYWCGPAPLDESLRHLTGLYKNCGDDKNRKRLVSAVGIHPASGPAFSFLASVLQGKDDNSIRKNAAFWLSRQDPGKALDLLYDTARKDRSEDVSNQAVFAISQIKDEKATDVLIRLTEKNNPGNTRKKAIFWLGQRDGERALASLKSIAESQTGDVPEQAVFAISQMKSEAALDVLIELARKSLHSQTRSKAIFWLSQKASKKTVAFLQEAADKEKDWNVKKQAVFAISQFPSDQSIPMLITLARENNDPRVRKQAIFWLGQSNDSRAVDFLSEIVKSAQ